MYTEFQSKPIESTPVLKGEDLINLVQSLYKTDTQGNLLVYAIENQHFLY